MLSSIYEKFVESRNQRGLVLWLVPTNAIRTQTIDALKNRDIVAKRMTPSQLEKAKDLAVECEKKNYKGC